LDYIAWRLAGSKLTDREASFPIFDTASGFISRGRKRWRNFHPGALAEIASLQPYNRPDPQRHFLWVLQELDARDKHKLLALSFMFNDGGDIEAITPPGMGAAYHSFSTDGRADHNAVIAVVTLPIPPGSPDPNVKVNTKLTFDIAFEWGIIAPDKPYPVRNTLKAIIQYVDSVVICFDKLIARNPDWIPRMS